MKVSVSVNINEYAYVRLTPAGEEAFRKAWEYASHLPSVNVDAMLKRVDSRGRKRFHIHDLLNIFGPACTLGMETPFKEGTIEFE